MTTPTVTAELHDWQFSPVPHRGPDAKVVLGFIYGDTRKRFADGKFVKTSTIVSVEDGLVVTLNSVYRLVGDEVRGQY